jgi:hypothetical protein
MQESHRQQLHKGMTESLLLAGIGSAYHRRNLASLPQHGDLLTEWVNGPGRDEIRSGNGWVVRGTSAATRDTAMLLARALHVNRLLSRVVTLRRLINQIIHSGDMIGDLTTCDVLVVLDFVQVYPGNEVPVTGREVQEVEDFLSDRFDRQKAHIIHVAKPLPGTWWSAGLCDRIASASRVLEVK